MTRINAVTAMVEQILSECPEARDSDVVLLIKVWEKYYGSRLFDMNGKKAIYLDDLFELPHEHRVKRVRAHLQNDMNLYLPTSWEVAKFRGIEESKWRAALGYQQPLVIEI